MELWLIAALVIVGALMRKAMLDSVRKMGYDMAIARCGLTWFLMIGFEMVAILLYTGQNPFGITEALLFLLIGMNIELPKINAGARKQAQAQKQGQEQD